MLVVICTRLLVQINDGVNLISSTSDTAARIRLES
jgi:hypothetical protein